MKFVTKFFLLLFFSTQIILAQYSWVQKQSGTSLGDPIDYEVSNTNNIYYGADNKIYKSTDRGENFTQLGTNIPTSSEIKNIILFDPDPTIMLVAVEASSNSEKIYKTTDAGQSWYAVLENANFSYFGIPMTPDPTNVNTVYTMDGNLFLKTTDFGENWVTVTSVVGFSAPCDIEVFPQNPDIILVGDNGNGIFRSSDGGNNWQQVYSTSGEIPTIAVDPNNPGVSFATKWGGGGGFLKSTDFGENWQSIGYFSGINMWGVEISPTNSDYVITGSYSSPYIMSISRDGGDTWMDTYRSSTNYSIVIIDTMTVFAALGSGFYKLESPYFIPVELTSFNAEIIDNKIQLNWETSTETNNQGFEIERSFDNKNFEKIGYVSGFGTTTEKKSYNFEIEDKLNKHSYFRLKQIDYDGSYEYSELVEVEGLTPSDYYLSQNFPNPFNPATTIEFSLPVEAKVKIELFNSIGEKISAIVNKNYSTGSHSIYFDAANLSSGNYIYVIEANGIDGSIYRNSKKMILIK